MGRPQPGQLLRELRGRLPPARASVGDPQHRVSFVRLLCVHWVSGLVLFCCGKTGTKACCIIYKTPRLKSITAVRGEKEEGGQGGQEGRRDGRHTLGMLCP